MLLTPFLLGALHRRSEFLNFSHDLIQNHLSKLPMLKKKIILVILKIKYFHLIEKTNVNYAEICRIGNLEADFNKFRLFNFSLCFYTTIIQIKGKVIFLDKNSKRHFTTDIA